MPGPAPRHPLRRHALRLFAWGVLGSVALFGYWQRAALLEFSRTGRWEPRRTVASVMDRYGERGRAAFQPACEASGVPWPPERLSLLVLKQERRLEVWGGGATGPLALLRTYPVFAMSGGPGPKRRAGDRQVPEGFYEIDGLNPNSLFHLSLRVDYPNAEDRAAATVPLEELGGDIFVHGGAASIGCVAIGDDAIEEVFTLVARVPPADVGSSSPPWTCA